MGRGRGGEHERERLTGVAAGGAELGQGVSALARGVPAGVGWEARVCEFLYLIADTSGIIRSVAVGCGRLVEIEESLREQVRRLHPQLEFPSDPASAASSSGAAVVSPSSHIVHLGVARVVEGPLEGTVPGRAQIFTAQFRYQVEGKPYVPYPVGLWTPTAEGIVAGRGGAENFVALRYDAGGLWAVLSPPRGERGRVWVLRDEAWPAKGALGADAHRDGRGAAFVEVTEPKLYEILRGTPGEHVAKLSPETQGVTFHALIVEPVPGARRQ